MPAEAEATMTGTGRIKHPKCPTRILLQNAMSEKRGPVAGGVFLKTLLRGPLPGVDANLECEGVLGVILVNFCCEIWRNALWKMGKGRRLRRDNRGFH